MKEALVVLDMVNDLAAYGGKINMFAKDIKKNLIVNKINVVIEKFRTENTPIFFIKTAFEKNYLDFPRSGKMYPRVRAKKALKMEEWGTNFVAGLDVRHDDTIIIKKSMSAFYISEPNLQQCLEDEHIEALHLVGVALDNAIRLTAREAYYRGYAVTIYPDCCGAKDNESHCLALEEMKPFFTFQFLHDISSNDSEICGGLTPAPYLEKGCINEADLTDF